MNAIQTDEDGFLNSLSDTIFKRSVNGFKVLLINARMRLEWHGPFKVILSTKFVFKECENTITQIPSFSQNT